MTKFFIFFQIFLFTLKKKNVMSTIYLQQILRSKLLPIVTNGTKKQFQL